MSAFERTLKYHFVSYCTAGRGKYRAVFTALEMSAIRLLCVCSSFDLEWSPSCRGDAVEVSRGPEFSAGGQLAGRYCGNRQPTRTTLPGAVWVRFRSNANNATGRGFVASYMSRMRAVATDVVRWRGLCVSVCLSSSTVEKVKVAHTRLPSVGADPGSWQSACR